MAGKGVEGRDGGSCEGFTDALITGANLKRARLYDGGVVTESDRRLFEAAVGQLGPNEVNGALEEKETGKPQKRVCRNFGDWERIRKGGHSWLNAKNGLHYFILYKN